MKELSEFQKTTIKEISKIQLKSFEQIFSGEKEQLAEKIELVDFDDFMDSLLDTTNYFKRLHEDPYLISDIDEYDVRPVHIILNHFYPQKENTNPEIQEIYDFLNEIEDFEDVLLDEDIDNLVIDEDIKKGEGNDLEFKPAILYHFTKKRGTQSIKYYIAQAICGFLNTEGGKLYIGINDDGKVQGLDYDFSLFEGDLRKKKDLFKLTFDNLITYYFGTSIHSIVKLSLVDYKGKIIGLIKVDFSIHKPVFLLNRLRNPETTKYDKIAKEYYIRGGASTKQIEDIEDIISYVRNKWDIA